MRVSTFTLAILSPKSLRANCRYYDHRLTCCVETFKIKLFMILQFKIEMKMVEIL